jgi:lipopolysaccharide transport system ATP-binding protein
MTKPVISVENLSKAYRIGLKEEIPDTLFGAFTAWVQAPVRNFRRLSRLDTARVHPDGHAEAEDDLIWALKDVSFQVQEGEVLGIIGRNGAGKSTLLKILSRITEPTSGRAVIRGRVSSLLEVGTGFHPELTGRENVYMNGTILGMTKREIDRKFDEIVEFSGVERFLDTPIKRYSSGMKVRLAFAVAAHLEPEILIVDEVLAVGDAEFQKKCMGKMQDVARGGRTVLFVSHNLPSIRALCSRGLWINKGRIALDADPSTAIAGYTRPELAAASTFPIRFTAATIEYFEILDAQGIPASSLLFTEPFTISFAVTLHKPLFAHVLLILWRRDDAVRVASFTTRELPIGPLEVGTTRFRISVDEAQVYPGNYYFSLCVLNENSIFADVPDAGSLTIEPSAVDGAMSPFTRWHGLAHVLRHYTIDVVPPGRPGATH